MLILMIQISLTDKVLLKRENPRKASVGGDSRVSPRENVVRSGTATHDDY